VATFGPGETYLEVQVPIFGDKRVEGNEDLRMLLSHPLGAALGSRFVAVGTIIDDRAGSRKYTFVHLVHVFR